MDEMEADILGIKKTNPKSPQKAIKGVGTAEPLAEAAKTKTTTKIERGEYLAFWISWLWCLGIQLLMYIDIISSLNY